MARKLEHLTGRLWAVVWRAGGKRYRRIWVAPVSGGGRPVSPGEALYAASDEALLRFGARPAHGVADEDDDGPAG